MAGSGYPKGGSEYGGYPGLIQPEPHPTAEGEMPAHERWMLEKLTDPADAASSPETVADDLRKQGRADRVKQHGA